MPRVIIYTLPTCPICKGVKKLLESKKIEFVEHCGEEDIKELGYSQAPLLKVDGEEEIYVGKAIYQKISDLLGNTVAESNK